MRGKAIGRKQMTSRETGREKGYVVGRRRSGSRSRKRPRLRRPSVGSVEVAFAGSKGSAGGP